MMETSPVSAEIGQVLARSGHKRGDLIPVLQDVQQAIGWLSPDAIALIAKHLSISKANVYGVATFYAQFRFKPIGRYHVKVCCGTACHVRGANRILERLEEDLKVEGGATSEDGKFSIEEVACFGSCALAPVIVVNDKAYGRMTSQKIERVVKGLK